MKGHIRERSPGRWAIVLEVQDEATGKRKRRWHSFTGTKSAARVECARLITELKSGNALSRTRPPSPCSSPAGWRISKPRFPQRRTSVTRGSSTRM
jgi:hypothetical protein